MSAETTAAVCRRFGMSPDCVEAIAILLLDTADELRQGPSYAITDDGPLILRTLIASREVAATRN